MAQRFDRRRFFQTGTAAAVGLSGVGTLAARAGEAGRGSETNVVEEPARQVSVAEEADVVVCGAGPAGVAAALASARSGAATRLIEANGCLGGVWTAGLLSWILDTSNKTGLMRELLVRLEQRGASHVFGGSVGYDVEEMKLLLEEMCQDAGVRIRLPRGCRRPFARGGRLKR